jgi:hypothetical protein
MVIHVSADLAGFDAEFMEKLKKDRLMFVSEVVDIGKRHGLTESQVDRILEQAERSGVGTRDEVFICLESVGDG